MSAAARVFTDEIEVLTKCAATRISQNNIKTIERLLSRPLDWEYILRTANRNAVLALVGQNLLKQFGVLLPPEIKKHLSEHLQTQMLRNTFLTSKLIEIIDLLQSHNIPLIAFKGPTLAVQAYGSLLLRQFGDLDILVQPQNLEKAMRLLNECGYTPIKEFEQLNTKYWSKGRGKDVCLINKDKSVIIELHWKLSGSYFSIPLETEELQKRAGSMALAGRKVNVLSFDDLFIYLCLHGARHGWMRLGWVCDIAQLIQSESNLDWSKLKERARKLGCERVVNLALFLVYSLWKIRVDLPDWENIENDGKLLEISNYVRKRLFSDNFIYLELSEWYLYHLNLKEKRFDRLKLHFYYIKRYFRNSFTLNEQDLNTFNLPNWLSPLYIVLRPSRLLFASLKKQFDKNPNNSEE